VLAVLAEVVLVMQVYIYQPVMVLQILAAEVVLPTMNQAPTVAQVL
jgi:hypothetical protein